MEAFVEAEGRLIQGRLTVDSNAIVFIPYCSVLDTRTHARLSIITLEGLSLHRILSSLPSTGSAVCLAQVSFVPIPTDPKLGALLLPVESEIEFLSLLNKSLGALGKSLKESPQDSGKYSVILSSNVAPSSSSNANTPTRKGIHGQVTGLLTNVLGAPLTASLEDAGWNVLESFAKVTHAARNTAVAAIEHPLARPLVPLVPRRIRSLVQRSSHELNRLLGEYETAIEFLARENRDGSSVMLGKVTPVDRGSQLANIMEIRLVSFLNLCSISYIDDLSLA
jgi:hypothetical protein